LCICRDYIAFRKIDDFAAAADAGRLFSGIDYAIFSPYFFDDAALGLAAADGAASAFSF